MRNPSEMLSLLPPEMLGSREIAGAIALQSRLVAIRIEKLGCIGRRSFGDKLKHGKRFLLSLDLDPVELAQHEPIADRRGGCWSNYDTAAVIFGHAFEADGGVHGLAHCRV